MGGLFLVLTGFMVVADVIIYRARRREISLVEEQLSERERAQEAVAQKAQELARSNADLEQFAYVASHDLQEPLRMVTSYTQLLAKRYGGKLDDDADEFIAYAVDGAERMRALISDLLAYSRVSTQASEPEPTDCEAVLDGALANLHEAIQESDAAVTRDPMPNVLADGPQLGQVFQNIVGNAIKYRGEKPPEVHVGAEQRNGQWLFSVRDNGIGMAICKKIVEHHGGSIWVDSEPGRGSTFHFTIPAEGGG